MIWMHLYTMKAEYNRTIIESCDNTYIWTSFTKQHCYIALHNYTDKHVIMSE